MPEIEPGPRKRFYEVRWPGDTTPTPAFAEKFFAEGDEAFDYSKQRQRELDPRRVQPPLPAAEDDGVWVALVEL